MFSNEKQDMIVVGSCGSGKSALYMIAANEAQDRKGLVVLLCPQRDVMHAAVAQCRRANISHVLGSHKERMEHLEQLIESGEPDYKTSMVDAEIQTSPG